MYSRTIRILTFLLLAVMVAPAANAGPWPQKRKHGFYKLGFGFVQANRFFELGGNQIDIPTLSDYTVSFYGEYGFTDRITGVAYVPFLQRITLNRQVGRLTGTEIFPGAENTGFADADIGIRVGLFQKGNTVVSTSLMLGIPLGDNSHENGLFTGDGEFNQHLSLGVGHSFYPSPAYVAVEAGYNNRTEGFSDEFRFNAEAGYTIQQKVTLIARLRGLESLDNGDDSIMGGMGGLSANNQSYLTFGFEAAYLISNRLGFSVSIESATRGQNILSAPAYSTGLFLTM